MEDSASDVLDESNSNKSVSEELSIESSSDDEDDDDEEDDYSLATSYDPEVAQVHSFENSL